MPATVGAGMASKREREEEDAVAKALQGLESVIDRDSDALKIQVSPVTQPLGCLFRMVQEAPFYCSRSQVARQHPRS